MRTLAYLEKAARESVREWKVLGLALLFAPAFVLIFFAAYGGTPAPSRLAVLDRDGGPEAAGLLRAWREARRADGSPELEVVEVPDLEAGLARVRERQVELLVEVPAGFSASLARLREDPTATPARLVTHADDRNLRAATAMALSDYRAFAYVAERTGARLPLDLAVAPAGGDRPPATEFEVAVPATLTLAIIMVLFTAATALVKEVDRGTMTRLMLSRLRTAELLAAVSVTQVLTGVVALALASLAAAACGYHGAGSLGTLLLVGAVGSLGVMAVAVLVSAFLRSMFELLTVGVFPFFVLMFFSDCLFPLPKVPVATLLGHTLYASDLLPTAVCARAFNQVLGFGAGPADVAFELGLMLVVTAGYFAVGSWLFTRRHQRV